MNHRKRTLFVLFIEVLFLLGGCLAIFAQFWFPANGGFTRNVLFIHSDESLDSQGYFIFVDELSDRAQKHDVDFVLHGRGSLSIAGKTSATFQTNSYTTNTPVSVKATFLSPITTITRFEGGFYPDFRRDSIYHEDNTTNYIKARYSGENTPVMGSVIYPHNDTDVVHPIPSVSGVNWNQFGKIGSNDLIYYQSERNLTTIYDGSLNVSSDAKILFIHQNSTDGLDYFYADCLTHLTYSDQKFFQSGYPVSILINYHNKTDYITGYVHLSEEYPEHTVEVRIRLPFSDNSPYTYVFDTEDPTVDIQDQFFIKETKESFSFSISINPINPESRIVESSPLVNYNTDPNIFAFPERSLWEIPVSTLENADSMYLLSDPTEIMNLQTKISENQEPWKSWYDAIISDVDTFVTQDISEWDEDQRDDIIRTLIAKYAIDGGVPYLEKIVEILQDMDAMDPLYEKDLRRSYALQAYSIAFDLIRGNLTVSERENIEQLLYNHALPLTNMQIYSDNNHRCVDAAGLGLTGLVIQNKHFVDLATETILTYLYEKPRDDGGSYEGQSYLAFALHQSIEYMVALDHIGGYDFFSNEKYLTCLKFMANCLSPLSTVPLYEDSYLTGDAAEVLIMAAPRISNSSYFEYYPNYLQWLYEIRQNNSALLGIESYYYLNGNSADLRRLVIYNPIQEINATIPNFGTQIFTQTNMAFFREKYTQNPTNSLYLSLSCKNFMQSHPHYDENSFELWGYGAWLIHNPGYPNFGKSGHDYTISTEASNTLLISDEGQKIPQAQGFTLTITSPYFDVVKADATQIYDSPGSWISAWAVNGFIYLSTALLGIAGIILTLRNPAKKENHNHTIDRKTWRLFRTDGETQISVLQSQPPSSWELRLAGAKDNLINIGLLATVNIIYFVFVIARFEFYMAYSDNPLKIVIPIRGVLYGGLLIMPVVLVFLAYRGYVNAFNRNIHRFLDFPNSSKELRGKTRKMIARNFLVHTPWIAVSSIVIGLTIVRYFVEFESIFFETVGGVGETVYYLFGWVQKYSIVLGILLVTQIPFTYVSLRRLNSELICKTNTITSDQYIKMKTLTICLLLKSVYILVYFGFFMILLYFASLIGIEML
ncbi:MAG: heparinase II/III family protein [Candidatus Lokiarchaeota archaeon]|nr:heparinase II/III family protein [Candidatus Lokiarchaeota archaeon]